MTEFLCRWPIIDDSLDIPELIAEAEADLPNVRPPGVRLTHRRWTIEDEHVCLRANVQPTSGYGRKLPADPLLTYVRARRPRLTKEHERVLHRARAEGAVTVTAADKFAVKVLGVHPCFIWGDDWFEDVA